MKVSREQVVENRRNILDAASRLFREKGFEAVSVAEVMKAAGLTHGGFYGHFKSKDDLIAQTLAHATGGAATLSPGLSDYAGDYLTADHCANLGGGCAVAALGAETIRQSPEARAAMTASLKTQIERLSEGAPGDDAPARRQAAIGAWSAMVGAMVLARMSDDPALAAEMLAATRRWIDQQAG